MDRQKKIVYVDMDNVLVDFESGLKKGARTYTKEYKGHEDDTPGIFSLMDPWPGAIEGINKLAERYDVYILTTAPWHNPSSCIDKRLWVEKYLPEIGHKKLVISHHKNLNKGDYIIDDRNAKGGR